ncbi:hypothetical protein Pa4123_53660 [Phytohabitans aurantiacus]|uniref:Pterin-4-alpha-carbinolamine dehydratase n=2 Tax=Phytohabitans aurantiacus TaxID=3016789 RepID=A0ABQ5R077_9ACTN|nr:hypothetical protein Pa4123_53660 [Phytohabitans aurantiacus]
MAYQAERGMSAPPEVVFNTATDPARSGWLPGELRATPPEVDLDRLRARWHDRAQLTVHPNPAGGARVELQVDGAPSEEADRALDDLARAVDDNLTAG